MSAGAPAPKHRLLLELGRGGMGIVYLARAGTGADAPLVVVKQLKTDLARDPEFRQMLIEEARLAARLTHPNVVRTLEAGFDGRHHYIAMELLDGQPLDAILRAPTHPFPIPLAVGVLGGVLAGLHAAHELRDTSGKPLDVVHRDVSPHNVFVTYDGDVKVLDFGIAKAADSSQRTRTGVVKGKATYMAPEQAARGRIDRRADVFAVGVILWEVIARRRFWGDLSEQEILGRLQRGEIDRVERYAPDAPPSLVAICARATAADAADRYATAEELRVALAEWSRDAGDAGRAELARFVSDAFAADRDQLASEIAKVIERDEHVELLDQDDVPVRGFSRTYALRLGSEGGTPAIPATARTVRTARRRRAATAALVLAVVVGGGVATSVAIRKPAATPASASPPAASPRRCASNAECAGANDGEPSLCRKDDGQCVALASIDCRVHAQPGEIENDATIWIGTMFPLTGPEAEPFGIASSNAAELARRDFAEVAHGLPSAGGARRPIGIVACDDGADYARAARHLVDDVRVAAIIGFHESSEAIDLASSSFLKRQVLSVASLNTNALVTQVPRPPDAPRLMWRTAISTVQTRAPIAAIVGDLLEPKLRAAPARLRKDDLMKVAMLRPSSMRGRAVADGFVADLRFNGKRALETTDGTFRDFAYVDPNDTPTPPDYASFVAEVAAFAPDVVIFLGNYMVKAIIEPLEAAWQKARPRPYYVANGPWEGEDFLGFLGKNTERRRRFFAVAPPTKTPPNARFVLRYNEAFSPKVTRANSPATPYDSFYLLAYAAVAAGDAPITGPALAKGIERLIGPGRALEVGASAIFEALEVLQKGATLELVGASGSLRFDPATGEAMQSFVVLCVGTDAQGKADDSIESGIVYDAKTKRLQGTLNCP